MKRLKWLLTLALALVMLAVSPMQVLAASQVEYISEIRLGYGDEGKAALEAEGFTVWTDLNANEGGAGSAVWVGYTVTDDPDEAITDVALMNMHGGYSFDAYTQEVEELNRQVTEQLANFAASIDAFRDNYGSGSPYAKEALTIMNCFYDDDTLDSSGDPTPVGDLLLDVDTSDETLHRIFLEGNTDAITAIERALALGCIEVYGDTVLDRLEEAEYPDELSASLSDARSNLLAVFEDFHSTAAAVQELYDEASDYEDGIDGFLSQETLSEAEKCIYATKLSQYALLASTDFGDTGMTLLDFALLDAEEENEDGEILEDEYLEMLAQSMTAGQLGLVANVGIMTILSNAAAGADAESAESAYDNLNDSVDLDETISVYYEVDRTLFSDPDTVALTSDALREKAAAESSDFGRDSGVDRTKAIVLTTLGAAALTAGVIATAIGAKAIAGTSADVLGNYEMVAEYVEEVGHNVFMAQAAGPATGSAVSAAGVITTVLGVVAIIAGVVLAIFAILEWLEKPETRKVEYTEIPRVIVERPAGQRSFITYYAAGLAGADEDETDSLALYGDLNALNGQDEWLALYYTKNPDMGSPITTEMLVQETGTLKTSRSDRYSPIHMFGSDSAANLNQYNTGSGAKDIYVFFRNDGSVANQAGSVFASGSAALSVVTFLLGAGLSAAVTYGLTRKRKPQAA